MGGLHAYKELPFTQMAEDASVSRQSGWPSHGADHSHSRFHLSRTMAASKFINVMSPDMPIFDNPEQQSFNGILRTPFNRPPRTPPPLYHFQPGNFYYPVPESPFPHPLDYQQPLSPVATCSSRSQSMSPHDDFRMPQQIPQYTYGSPSDSQISLNPYYASETLVSAAPIRGGGAACIALQEIQAFPDQVSEIPTEEHGQLDIKLEVDVFPTKMDIVRYPEEDDSDADYKPSTRTAGKRGRRRTSSHPSPAIRRSIKRHNGNIPGGSSHEPRKVKRPRKPDTTNYQSATDNTRPFPCPLAIYSCNATFASKNEWKRHVYTQHIREGFWRCDLCPPSQHDSSQAVYYNDFNRKDLFTQHLRRMHTSSASETKNAVIVSNHGADIPPVNENTLSSHQTRCFKTLRSPPPASACLFCSRSFRGVGSWEERMEHVGKHFEKEGKGSIDPAHWRPDPELQNWFLREGLIEQAENGWKLGDGVPRRDFGDDGSDEDADGEEEED